MTDAATPVGTFHAHRNGPNVPTVHHDHRDGSWPHQHTFDPAGRVVEDVDPGGTLDVDALVRQLDERGETWSLYRGQDNLWRVQMGDGHGDVSARCVEGDRIVDALAAAVESRRLPVVPLRPVLHAWTVERGVGASSGWYVLADGTFACRRGTKREATATAERFASDERARFDDWMTTWGPVVAAGGEGVEWRWGRP